MASNNHADTIVVQRLSWTSDSGKKRSDSVDNDAYRYSVLESVFRPLIIYGRLTGVSLYSHQDTSPMLRGCMRLTVTTTLFYTLFCFLRSLFFIDGMEERLNTRSLMKLLIIHYFFVGVVAAVCNLSVQRRMARLLHLIVRETGNVSAETVVFLKWFVWVMTVICAVASIYNIWMLPMAAFGHIHLPFPPRIIWGSENQNVSLFPHYVLLDALAHFNTQNTMYYCSVIYVVFCVILYRSGGSLLEEMKMANEPVTHYEQRYQTICDGVHEINHLYRYYCFIEFSLFIAMVLLAMYTLVRDPTVNTYTILVFVCWMAQGLLHVMLFTLPAILLNDQGERLLHTAYQMQNAYISKFGRDAGIDLQLFALRISVTRLEITAAGYFSINRPIILTLFSVVATYFIIILQFDIAEQPLLTATTEMPVTL